MPENAQDAYNSYSKNDWKGNYKGQSEGTRAGGKWDNDGKNGAQILPESDLDGNDITYREFDVNSKAPDFGRDAERFVVGSDNKIYYTNDHYISFVEVVK